MCDTLVIVQPDRVLFAKNSDRDANEAQLLEWRPRESHGDGARVRCTWIEIPQARETHAALLSRPFWMWGAEMGANEHGVTIGNEAVFTREPLAKSGLTGMDMLRLALERAATAERAVELMTELLETHGQGGGCGHENRGFTYHNSFIVADPTSAFVLETAGKKWATERVEPGRSRSISNGLTIPEFADKYSDRLKTTVSACRLRQPRTAALAGEARGVRDLFAALRDHGDGRTEPEYSWINGGMGAPCMHAGGLLAASQTTASWVAELRRAGAGFTARPELRHWVTATAAPCTSLFKPVSVTEPVDLVPAPDDRYDPKCLWWAHERFHRTVMRDPAAAAKIFTEERDAIEAEWTERPPAPAEAFATHREVVERWLAEVAARNPADRRPGFVRRYWAKRDRRAGLPPLTQPVTTKTAVATAQQ